MVGHIYRVVLYAKSTEIMWANLSIPASLITQVKTIAGFKPEDDGLGEYPLDAKQIRKIAQLLGFSPEPDKFYDGDRRRRDPCRD